MYMYIALPFLIIAGATIITSGEFGTLLNYSLVENITCTGVENSFSDCIVHEATGCIPWCPNANVALRCFSTF